MTTIGLAMGGNARTGMEDTLTLEKGVPAESNLQLVERLVGIAHSMQLEPATVAEVDRAAQAAPGARQRRLSRARAGSADGPVRPPDRSGPS